MRSLIGLVLAVSFLATAALSTNPSRVISVAASEDPLVVTTKTGKVRGVVRPSGGAEFLGIPYAQPPVGDLRWREPLPVKAWWGVGDAKLFGAPCAQATLGDWNKHDAEMSSENCLFVNVITPAWPARTRLPVMFWIHGGANAGSTASSLLYKDGTLINHGVILVTVNYRLGVFGFFAHPELTRESTHHASGNYGLIDQIAALRWVHDNIEKFGGDPTNVTVFGQSAGAQDTSLLMASPLAHGLFQRVIAQSGTAINPPTPSLGDSEKAGEKIASLLKTPLGEGAIKYLRSKPTLELLSAVPIQNPTQVPLLGPNVDGWVIPNSPDRVFSQQQQSPVPLLIGTTAREFSFASSADGVRQFISSVAGNLSPRALQVYGLDDNKPGTTDPMYGPVGDQWFSDLVFRCPVAILTAWHSTLNKSTYQYEFARAIPGNEEQGAIHAGELPYVFGYYPKSGNISGKFSEIDFKLAELIETYWTNFAKTGDPNSSSTPNWPRFNSSQTFIRFTPTGEVDVITGGLRPIHCDLFRELLKQRMQK